MIAILHSLGVQAEPVLVQASLGDMIADRLPMIGLFNHVLVRAHVGAKDYWLDGTRTGDSDLDSIEVPDFGWGLPVLAGSKFVQMVPAPLTTPRLERHVSIDASGGVYAPAPITIDEIYRGDSAIGLGGRFFLGEPLERFLERGIAGGGWLTELDIRQIDADRRPRLLQQVGQGDEPGVGVGRLEVVRPGRGHHVLDDRIIPGDVHREAVVRGERDHDLRAGAVRPASKNSGSPSRTAPSGSACRRHT